jgi:RNA-binding protein 39
LIGLFSIGYVEFYYESSVPKAVGLTGQRLLGVPVMVKPSEAEKNRQVEATFADFNMNEDRRFIIPTYTRLHIQNIHTNLVEKDIYELFSAFGYIDEVVIARDSDKKSRGVAYVQFKQHLSAKKALEAMDNFELAGKYLKVSVSNERMPTSAEEKAEFILSSKDRTELMKKLADKHSINVNAISPCIVMLNMYDPNE